MEQHIQTTRDVYFTRARIGVERVDDTEERTEGAVRDPGLGGEVGEVGDGGTGGLRAMNNESQYVFSPTGRREGEEKRNEKKE